MEDLRSVIVLGMSTNDIVSTFGLPDSVETVGKSTSEWRYGLPAFPADEEVKGSYVNGLILGITNGYLAGWTCAYEGPSAIRSVNEGAVASGDESTGIRLETRPSLKLFLVSATSIPGWRFIATEQLPHLGYIRSEPDLEISTITEVSWEARSYAQEDGQDRRIWRFSIYLNRDDAARLEELTTANVSKQLLIMIGGVAVSAPRIMSRLDAGSIIIECDESLPIEAIKEHLTVMSKAVP